jgi:ABC-type branched-subunit amino acid transport system substrate-binding protein
MFNRTVLDDQADAAGLSLADFVELPEVQDLLDRYEAEVGPLPSGPFRVFVATAYDAARVLLNALAGVASVGTDGALGLERSVLAAAVRATSGFPGVTGDITLTEGGNRQP